MNELSAKLNALSRVKFSQVEQSGLATLQEGYSWFASQTKQIKFNAFGKEWEERWYAVKGLELLSYLGAEDKAKVTARHLGIMSTWIRENYQHTLLIPYPTKPAKLKVIGIFLKQIINKELRDEESKERKKECLKDIDELFITITKYYL